MKLEPIEYNGGVIWVNTTKFPTMKKGQSYWRTIHSIVNVCIDDKQYFEDDYPIVAQSPNLSIPNIPYVEVEEDVEHLAKQFITDEWAKDDEPIKFGIQVGFIEGYKAASTKKWSDEDIRKAIRQGEINEGCTACRKTDDEFLQSLQPKIKNIEIEMTQGAYYDFLDCPVIGEERPMTYEKDGKTFLKVKTVTYD